MEAYLGAGFGDLVVGNGRLLILIEIELGMARIHRDLAKARQIAAHELWIVAATASLRCRVERAIEAESRRSECEILVLTYPLACQRFRELEAICDRDE